MNNGWVKIHRQLKEKGYYKDSECVHLWLHLLLTANREEKEFMWNGAIQKIKKGQLITGRRAIEKDTGVNQHKVDRVLDLFEKDGQIEQQKMSKYRLITLLNWEKYQTIEPQVSHRRATSEPQVSTNKNQKNQKNEEKEEKGDTPAQKALNFFSRVSEGGKSLIEFLQEIEKRTGVPFQVLSQEVRKFHSYWTEFDSTGKRQRWQKQETFEVDKRFRTWLTNAGKFSGASAPKNREFIL